MASIIFDSPLQQLSFLRCLITVLFFIPFREPLHSLDLRMYPSSQHLLPQHTQPHMTSAGVAEFAGGWEDRRDFTSQKHININVGYNTSENPWPKKVLGPLYLLYSYHSTHVFSPTLSSLPISQEKIKIPTIVLCRAF